MAELINNVKMRLILPNNDQESFVNAINYNFHQLANIANHVDAKRGEKGEQGIRGAQGPKGQKGDRGPGIFTFTGNPSDLSSGDEYIKFINENSISDGDMIMYDGVIYNYDKTPASMNDYINDHSGEDGKNRYINTDMSGDIEAKVKEVLSEDIAGSMTYKVINNGGIAFVTPKTVNDMDAKYSEGDNAKKSMTAVFTTNLDPDETKKSMDGYVNHYSINSLCNSTDTFNIRLGYENFTAENKNFAVINFDEPSDSDSSGLSFYLLDNSGSYKKPKAKYSFWDGSNEIASIGINTGITSIKLKKLSIESQHGAKHAINSDNIPLEIRGSEPITVFSNKSVSIGVPNEKKTFIKLDNNNNISILANATDGANPNSSIVLNGQDPNNARIDIKSRIVFLNGFSVQLQSAHNIIKANGADDCDIKMSCEYKNGGISNSYITLDKNGLLLSYLHPTDANKSSIALKAGRDGLSTIEISSIRYILSHSTFGALKDKNGINLDNVNIDNIEDRYYRTYLASNDTLAIASNNNILLFPGKDGYINLYTDKIKFFDNNKSVIYYGDFYPDDFIPPYIGSNDSFALEFGVYRFWRGRVLYITSYNITKDKEVMDKGITSESEELNILWSYAFKHGVYLGSDIVSDGVRIKGKSRIISVPLSSITNDASTTAGEHVVIGAREENNQRYLQVVYIHRSGVGENVNKFTGQLFYI